MSPEPMLSFSALLSVQTLSSVLQVLHRWVLKERYTGDAISRRPMLEFIVSLEHNNAIAPLAGR